MSDSRDATGRSSSPSTYQDYTEVANQSERASRRARDTNRDRTPTLDNISETASDSDFQLKKRSHKKREKASTLELDEKQPSPSKPSSPVPQTPQSASDSTTALTIATASSGKVNKLKKKHVKQEYDVEAILDHKKDPRNARVCTSIFQNNHL